MKNLILLLLLAPFLATAQTWEVVTIDEGKGYYAPEEPAILINPTNPQNMVAAANIKSLYVSNDGGKSWEKTTMKSQHGVFGDPCLISNTKGQIFYFHLSDPSGKGWSSDDILDRIVCQRSDDGERLGAKEATWDCTAPKIRTKEWAVVDPRNDNIYVTWTQFDTYGSKGRSG